MPATAAAVRRQAPPPPASTSYIPEHGVTQLIMASRGYEYLYKILFIGDSGVGKTAVIWRFSEDTFSGVFIHTIGKYQHMQDMAGIRYPPPPPHGTE